MAPQFFFIVLSVNDVMQINIIIIDLSDQKELYHPSLLSKIWYLREAIPQENNIEKYS